MRDNSDKLSKIEEALEETIKVITKGKYKKIHNEYFFNLEEDSEFIASIEEKTIDFKISTMKWIPGNYEPIIGNELYSSVKLKELEAMEKVEILMRLSEIINNLENNRNN